MTSKAASLVEKTTAIINSKGLITATSKGRGHDEARMEIAQLLEYALEMKGLLIEKDPLTHKRTLNLERFETAIIDFQNQDGITDRSLNNERSLSLQADGIVGPKTLKALTLTAGVYAAAEPYKHTTAPSCRPVGLGQMKGADCPQVERFAQQVSMGDKLSPNDKSMLKTLKYVFKTPETPPSCTVFGRVFEGRECRGLEDFIATTTQKPKEERTPTEENLLNIIKGMGAKPSSLPTPATPHREAKTNESPRRG